MLSTLASSAKTVMHILGGLQQARSFQEMLNSRYK